MGNASFNDEREQALFIDDGLELLYSIYPLSVDLNLFKSFHGSDMFS